MKILVSGSHGFVGSAFVRELESLGHQAHHLVRRQPYGPSEIFWDPALGYLDAARLEGFDAIVHLAGESIASGRWTRARKERILNSRVQGTRLLCESLAKLDRKPRVLASASAIGFYGDRGGEVLKEDSGSGRGFLAEVCRQWEGAVEPAAQAGIRVVPMRFGIILSAFGGALSKMLFPFRMGLGGVLGHGRQWMSWVALDDVVSAIRRVIEDERLRGPLNVVSPKPVTNREFTQTLGRVLSRPALVPMPAFLARAVLGEMADELLLSSARVEPAKLVASGYPFKHPGLEEALRVILGN